MAMFSDVTMDTELMRHSTEALLLVGIQGQVPESLWSVAFSSTDPYIILFYVCFSLKTP